MTVWDRCDDVGHRAPCARTGRSDRRAVELVESEPWEMPPLRRKGTLPRTVSPCFPVRVCARQRDIRLAWLFSPVRVSIGRKQSAAAATRGVRNRRGSPPSRHSIRGGNVTAAERRASSSRPFHAHTGELERKPTSCRGGHNRRCHTQPTFANAGLSTRLARAAGQVSLLNAYRDAARRRF